MRSRSSVLYLVLALVAFAILSPGVSLAATHVGIQEGTFDVSQVDWDLSEPVLDGGPQGSPQGEDTSQSDPTCIGTPINPAPDYTYIYKHFGTLNTALKAIEYDPANLVQGNTFPVMVLAHGGGWATGCRLSMAGPAFDFARGDASLPHHFIALSIDYRLTCDPGDPSISGSQIAQLCGWFFNTPDPQWSNTPGAAIHDVEDAVAWVRNVWATNANAAQYWNGKIALVGGSAGGNLSLMAATLALSSPYRPDAVAGLSPTAKFTLMTDPYHPTVWMCDPPQSKDSLYCARGKQNQQYPQYWEGGVNRYLQCPGQPPPGPYYYDGYCLASYQAAGPDGVVSSQGIYPPSTYQVNGGGPVSGFSAPELASLQSAIDFDVRLGGNPNLSHSLCTVDAILHGTRLLSQSCEGSSNTVRWDMVDWLGDNGICDINHPCSP